jgi:hypothetical protein
MTNVEHLIENAMVCLENGVDKDHYLHSPMYQKMAKTLGVPLDIFWEIAEYMTQTYIPTLMSDLLETYHIGRPFHKVE